MGVADQTIYRVTMRLTESDVQMTEQLQKQLAARSKADAISQAIAIASTIVQAIVSGKEVLIRSPGSEYAERVLLPKVRVGEAA
jgi:hypothetical protein